MGGALHKGHLPSRTDLELRVRHSWCTLFNWGYVTRDVLSFFVHGNTICRVRKPSFTGLLHEVNGSRLTLSPCKTVTYRGFFRDTFFSVIRFCDERTGIPGAPDSVSAFPESMGFPIPIRNDGTLSLPVLSQCMSKTSHWEKFTSLSEVPIRRSFQT